MKSPELYAFMVEISQMFEALNLITCKFSHEFQKGKQCPVTLGDQSYPGDQAIMTLHCRKGNCQAVFVKKWMLKLSTCSKSFPLSHRFLQVLSGWVS